MQRNQGGVIIKLLNQIERESCRGRRRMKRQLLRLARVVESIREHRNTAELLAVRAGVVGSGVHRVAIARARGRVEAYRDAEQLIELELRRVERAVWPLRRVRA